MQERTSVIVKDIHCGYWAREKDMEGESLRSKNCCGLGEESIRDELLGPSLVGIRKRCHEQTHGSQEEELVCGEYAMWSGHCRQSSPGPCPGAELS